MISIILKSYLTIFLAVGIGSLLIFVSGVYFIFSRGAPKTAAPLEAIAGDDLVATQLDLARAYIETANISSAISILKQVLKQGSKTQQDEARSLLNLART